MCVTEVTIVFKLFNDHLTINVASIGDKPAILRP